LLHLVKVDLYGRLIRTGALCKHFFHAEWPYNENIHENRLGS